MNFWIHVAVSGIFLLELTTFVHGMLVTEASLTTKCEFYNSSCAAAPESCSTVKECEPPGEYKRNHCFVVWAIQPDGSTKVSLKGCFLNHDLCFNKPTCVEKAGSPKNNVLFCCCEGDLCNKNFTWEPEPTEAQPPSTAAPVFVREESNVIYYVLGAILTVVGLLALVVVFWYRRQKQYFDALPTTDSHPMPPPSPQLDCRPIQLIEVKARGRFGAVWKAQFKTEEDKQSWQTEQDIFKLPFMAHPNILDYIGVEKRGENLQAEFWLITAYHEKGSLCDYLKANTLSWNELCRIAQTMGTGLMHLHEAIPGKSPGETSKPTIAHRDFKSKNVLLKSDLTACIADFGLAITFEAGKSCGDTHGQVGTRRYMAPEVLEGAINFTSDAFLRIDMYACGLVLWELVSRCKSQDGPIPDYRLPFEDEVGGHPSLEDMQESVVQNKVRPTIKKHWRTHPGLAVLCDTMEECWDPDPEARLSASCVIERISVQSRFQQPIINFGRIENEYSCEPLMNDIV
ncbi:hypothetical protein HUJ05_001265 [Dendroctonus ponderosae]|nr:hypothetical protein HUJ05_001265 [Dendroctonus ponderosae]KAH1027829.1 hypothetical protein HUJ05_001265 [Dendroctonus ponderosae]